jgi:hypothetical protein
VRHAYWQGNRPAAILEAAYQMVVGLLKIFSTGQEPKRSWPPMNADKKFYFDRRSSALIGG